MTGEVDVCNLSLQAHVGILVISSLLGIQEAEQGSHGGNIQSTAFPAEISSGPLPFNVDSQVNRAVMLV